MRYGFREKSFGQNTGFQMTEDGWPPLRTEGTEGFNDFFVFCGALCGYSSMWKLLQ
jgi:hypothetical protein